MNLYLVDEWRRLEGVVLLGAVAGAARATDELGLAPDHGHVVVAHPLVALEGVGPHGIIFVVDSLPIVMLHFPANLKEVQMKSR